MHKSEKVCSEAYEILPLLPGLHTCLAGALWALRAFPPAALSKITPLPGAAPFAMQTRPEHTWGDQLARKMGCRI